MTEQFPDETIRVVAADLDPEELPPELPDELIDELLAGARTPEEITGPVEGLGGTRGQVLRSSTLHLCKT